MMIQALQPLLSACKKPQSIVATLLRDNHRVVRVLGHDAPYSLIRACGATPVRMAPDTTGATPQADQLIGTATLGQRGRSLLEQILTDDSLTPLLITHADCETPQLFAALRELMRTGDMPARPVHFLDLLHLPRDSSQRYNLIRIQQCADWLQRIGGVELTPQAWAEELSLARHAAELLSDCRTLRDQTAPRLTAAHYNSILASAHILPREQWLAQAQQCLRQAAATATPLSGTRVLVAGPAQFSDQHYDQLLAAGLLVVGDYQDWGDPLIDTPLPGPIWQEDYSQPGRHRPIKLISAASRAEQLCELASARLAEAVIYLHAPDDEASAWDGEAMASLLSDRGIKAGVWAINEPLPARPESLWSRDKPDLPNTTTTPAANSANRHRPPKPQRPNSERSRKSLQSVASFNSYQREWFKNTTAQVREGTAFGLVNANSPQEFLRAMDLPYVVNQWWASIVAAKQQSRRYFQLLRENGYPADVESYSAQGLAAFFDHDSEQSPWGGLPTPDFLQAVTSTEPTSSIFDHWSRESGAELFLFEATVDPRIDIAAEWWEKLPDHWDEELETARLDLLTEELQQAINALEKRTGQQFDHEKFVEIMSLVNEQEEYYQKTRDLIASTHPAPVSIVDTIPATMVPQWHRGTKWGRDAAKNFYQEVAARIEAGEGACKHERLRLMWVGRGMWSQMGFYQQWEQSHGAVFVWSMYLALAADGYIRYFDRGRDPMRALAARFITMGEELRMPTWAGAWHVREAKTHKVDAAIALTDADPFVLRALKRAGIPVLALDLDNFNQENSQGEAIKQTIDDFLDRLH